MKLYEVLGNNNFELIKYMMHLSCGDNMEVGHCSYIDENLQSLDGNRYSVFDRVEDYEFDENGTLVIWIPDELSDL